MVSILKLREYLLIGLSIEQSMSQRDGDPGVILRQIHDFSPPQTAN